jgi:hypothetical protein
VHRIKRFAFLLGGVLVPRIGDVIQPLRPDFSLDTVELYQLKKQLTLGQLSLNDFCKRLESLSSEIDVSWERDFPLIPKRFLSSFYWQTIQPLGVMAF